MEGAAGADRGRDPRRALVVDGLALGVLALAVRLTYWRLAIPDYVPERDAAQYAEIASHVLHGDGFATRFPRGGLHPTAFRPPLYPVVLAGTWWVFGEGTPSGQALGIALGVAVVLATWVLGRRLGRAAVPGTDGRRCGLVAAAAVALFPPLVANDVVLLSESLALLLLLLTLVGAIDRRPVIAGAAAGLLLLTRPSAPLVVVAIVGWALWSLGVRRTAALGAVAVSVVAPWIVRNSIALGGPTLYTSNGFNLAAVYSVEAQDDGGFVDAATDPRFADAGTTDDEGDPFDELRWSNDLGTRGLDGLRMHPPVLLRVVGANLRTAFELAPANGDAADLADGRSLTVRRWGLPAFYVVTVLGAAGLWRHRRLPAVLLLVLVDLATLASMALFLAAPRLRAPFDLVSCLGLGLLATALRGDGLRVLRTRSSFPA